MGRHNAYRLHPNPQSDDNSIAIFLIVQKDVTDSRSSCDMNGLIDSDFGWMSLSNSLKARRRQKKEKRRLSRLSNVWNLSSPSSISQKKTKGVGLPCNVPQATEVYRNRSTWKGPSMDNLRRSADHHLKRFLRSSGIKLSQNATTQAKVSDRSVHDKVPLSSDGDSKHPTYSDPRESNYSRSRLCKGVEAALVKSEKLCPKSKPSPHILSPRLQSAEALRPSFSSNSNFSFSIPTARLDGHKFLQEDKNRQALSECRRTPKNPFLERCLPTRISENDTNAVREITSNGTNSEAIRLSRLLTQRIEQLRETTLTSTSKAEMDTCRNEQARDFAPQYSVVPILGQPPHTKVVTANSAYDEKQVGDVLPYSETGQIKDELSSRSSISQYGLLECQSVGASDYRIIVNPLNGQPEGILMTSVLVDLLKNKKLASNIVSANSPVNEANHSCCNKSFSPHKQTQLRGLIAPGDIHEVITDGRLLTDKSATKEPQKTHEVGGIRGIAVNRNTHYVENYKSRSPWNSIFSNGFGANSNVSVFGRPSDVTEENPAKRKSPDIFSSSVSTQSQCHESSGPDSNNLDARKNKKVLSSSNLSVAGQTNATRHEFDMPPPFSNSFGISATANLSCKNAEDHPTKKPLNLPEFPLPSNESSNYRYPRKVKKKSGRKRATYPTQHFDPLYRYAETSRLNETGLRSSEAYTDVSTYDTHYRNERLPVGPTWPPGSAFSSLSRFETSDATRKARWPHSSGDSNAVANYDAYNQNDPQPYSLPQQQWLTNGHASHSYGGPFYDWSQPCKVVGYRDNDTWTDYNQYAGSRRRPRVDHQSCFCIDDIF